MAAQFRAVLHLGLLRVPDAEGAVGGTGGDEESGRVPCDGPDAGKGLVWGWISWACCGGGGGGGTWTEAGQLARGQQTCLLVGAWASGGRIVVGLCLEGGK